MSQKSIEQQRGLLKGAKVFDVEIDRRDYNGWTLLLLEDRHKGMMLPDGTSKHYILCVETRAVEVNIRESV
ncbi:MAG: hypothetical protein ACHQ6U_11190 [Thermodesulfobacteriota bacterium]